MSGSIFRHEQRVSYSLCTIGNHVYYSRYLDILEVARGEFFRHLGLPFRQWQEREIIFPVVECQLRYKGAARYDDAQLVESPRRFGELAEQLPGISPNILTDRLRHLERNGMVATVPYSRRPIRLAYGLTDSGRDLHGAIGLLAAWGARRTGTAEGPVHDACGTPLEARLFCPTCSIPVDEAHDEVLRWL